MITSYTWFQTRLSKQDFAFVLCPEVQSGDSKYLCHVIHKSLQRLPSFIKSPAASELPEAVSPFQGGCEHRQRARRATFLLMWVSPGVPATAEQIYIQVPGALLCLFQQGQTSVAQGAATESATDSCYWVSTFFQSSRLISVQCQQFHVCPGSLADFGMWLLFRLQFYIHWIELPVALKK